MEKNLLINAPLNPPKDKGIYQRIVPWQINFTRRFRYCGGPLRDRGVCPLSPQLSGANPISGCQERTWTSGD